MEFIIDNLVWFIAGGVVILMTIIGYFAEKTDFGKKMIDSDETDDSEPKKEKVKPLKKEKKSKKEKEDKQPDVQMQPEPSAASSIVEPVLTTIAVDQVVPMVQQENIPSENNMVSEPVLPEMEKVELEPAPLEQANVVNEENLSNVNDNVNDSKNDIQENIPVDLQSAAIEDIDVNHENVTTIANVNEVPEVAMPVDDTKIENVVPDVLPISTDENLVEPSMVSEQNQENVTPVLEVENNESVSNEAVSAPEEFGNIDNANISDESVPNNIVPEEIILPQDSTLEPIIEEKPVIITDEKVPSFEQLENISVPGVSEVVEVPEISTLPVTDVNLDTNSPETEEEDIWKF